jgi:GT2 family glycosyltransferase
MGMRFSVIVPVHNARETLADCLAGLGRSSSPPEEVLVVDDGSTDDSANVARAHRGVTLLTGATQGPRGAAWARNRGAERASGDVLVFIDADVVVHADALARMAAVFAGEPTVHALFGSYDEHPPCSDIPSRFKNLLHHYVHQHGKRAASSFWTGCGAIKRDTFVAMGGFDERYERPSIEDIELGVRLFRAGMAIRLCPEIQATHLKRWSLMNLWRTDVFARAVPWTRLVLRDAHLPDDLNLGWRSRVSALSSWAALLLAASACIAPVGALTNAAYAGVAAGLTVSTALNADLHRFFVRRGGLRFAAGAWLLHHAYLLYGSAVFATLTLGHALRRTAPATLALTRPRTP